MGETLESTIARFKAMPRDQWLEAARTVLEVRAVLMLRGLTEEARFVGTAGHMTRERRMVALSAYAEARDDEAMRIVLAAENRPTHHIHGGHRNELGCGARCIWTGPGPCSCRAPLQLLQLRRRQRAILWANQALLRE
jgi:hypothetical protein